MKNLTQNIKFITNEKNRVVWLFLINEEYIAIIYFSNVREALDYWYVGHKKRYFKYINSLIKLHISNCNYNCHNIN